MMQGTTVYSTYLSDQLREDMKRDEQVNEGKLSRSEADQQADEWSQVSSRICFLSRFAFASYNRDDGSRKTIAEIRFHSEVNQLLPERWLLGIPSARQRSSLTPIFFD
jgi:hypothetical protein